MKTNKITTYLVLSLILGLLIVSCRLEGKLDVEEEQEVLERSVLSTYASLNRTWQVASARGGEANFMQQLAKTEAQAVRAFDELTRLRRSMLDYKKNGLLGEGNDGLLYVLTEKNLASSPEELRRAQELSSQINSQRLIIVDSIIDLDENLSANDKPIVMYKLSQKYQDESLPGNWIQNADGQWIQKK